MLDKGYVVIDMKICNVTWNNNIVGKLKKMHHFQKQELVSYEMSTGTHGCDLLQICYFVCGLAWSMYMASDKIICNIHDYGNLLSSFCLILLAITTLKFIIVVTYFHSCTWCMLPLVAHVTFIHWRFLFLFLW